MYPNSWMVYFMDNPVWMSWGFTPMTWETSIWWDQKTGCTFPVDYLHIPTLCFTVFVRIETNGMHSWVGYEYQRRSIVWFHRFSSCCMLVVNFNGRLAATNSSSADVRATLETSFLPADDMFFQGEPAKNFSDDPKMTLCFPGTFWDVAFCLWSLMLKKGCSRFPQLVGGLKKSGFTLLWMLSQLKKRPWKWDEIPK